MIVVIHDANVLIDLHSAKLLDRFFKLGMENHTSDLVIDEVEQSLIAYIKNKKLLITNWSGEELLEISKARDNQPKSISIPDSSVLVLTKRLGGTLLTGDGNLRFCAEQAGLEVRGTLWIFDQLVDSQLLPKPEAVSLLEKLKVSGRRFPPAECAVRIKRWQG